MLNRDVKTKAALVNINHNLWLYFLMFSPIFTIYISTFFLTSSHLIIISFYPWYHIFCTFLLNFYQYVSIFIYPELFNIYSLNLSILNVMCRLLWNYWTSWSENYYKDASTLALESKRMYVNFNIPSLN